MHVRPSLTPIRLAPAPRPAAAVEAAPAQVAAALATALPADGFVDRLADRVYDFVQSLKEKLRPEPPVVAPEPPPVAPSPAPKPVLPKPTPKPRPVAPSPLPVRPSLPKAPTNAELHGSREAWFFSQYESKYNPNEDVKGNANCGPTALTMIAKAFGKIDPTHAEADEAIEESRRRMKQSQDEMEYTSTTGLVRGARSYGLYAVSKRIEDLDTVRRELDRGKLLIANVVPKYLSESNTGGHFTVVTAIKDGKVYMNDPASRSGPIVITEAEFLRALEVKGSYAFVSIGSVR